MTVSPVACWTSGGPAEKTCDACFTMTEKCDAGTSAAGSPATGPSAAATTGTVERQRTASSHPTISDTYETPIDSIDFTLPPAPSRRRISGTRCSSAMRSAYGRFWPTDASDAPPRTVKSYPVTTTGRCSTLALPRTRFDGVKPISCPVSSYSPRPVRPPTSAKDPASVNRSMRSRIVEATEPVLTLHALGTTLGEDEAAALGQLAQ